jgi:hypothetical protein
MYKFADWFLEYMKHIDKFCNKENIINTICCEDILKGHYDVLYDHPEFISCGLSLDTNAINLLENHPRKICWTNLSSNSKAVPLLNKYPDKINWYWLSVNTGAKELLLQNINKIMFYHLVPDFNNYISWKLLHYNYEAIDILDLYKETINWTILSYINHEKVIDYLLKNIEHINWTMLSFNTCAHSIFIKYPELVDWKYLSLHPFAIDILTNNQDRIDWDYFSFNEEAIPLLKENPDKINWRAIMFNKNGRQLIEENLDCICWSEWKIFTILIKKLQKLDKRVYLAGIEYLNIITDITYDLKQNYKNNLDYFGKCFVYEQLLNIDDKEIINSCNINFYLNIHNYSLLLRDKIDCVHSTIHNYRETFIQQMKQRDKPFATLIKEAFTYIGPPQYNPIYSICNNIEFNYIVETNPDKMEWILKLLDSLGCDENIYFNILENIDIITLDYQKMALERTHILREELMMKVWHPSNVERLLNAGFTIDDL